MIAFLSIAKLWIMWAMPKKKPQFTFVKLPGMSAAISTEIPRETVEMLLAQVQQRIAARKQKQLVTAHTAQH
ncbi:MAG: hypothetical protein IPJ18_18335 [Betaproteobacteria bacterium]|jgi:hypothetical protein|nr:hypothetical protein [Betaproteobacteria bacterium]